MTLLISIALTTSPEWLYISLYNEFNGLWVGIWHISDGCDQECDPRARMTLLLSVWTQESFVIIVEWNHTTFEPHRLSSAKQTSHAYEKLKGMVYLTKGGFVPRLSRSVKTQMSRPGFRHCGFPQCYPWTRPIKLFDYTRLFIDCDCPR